MYDKTDISVLDLQGDISTEQPTVPGAALRHCGCTKATVLFFHQSSDLYGSDRTLLYLVRRLDRAIFEPIVVLPTEGPLSHQLAALGIEVHILPLALVQTSSLNVAGCYRLARKMFRSVRAIHRVFAHRQISIVHSNTLAVLSGAVWARALGIPHVWHVHEMVHQSRIVRRLVATMVKLLSNAVVFNSHATKNHLIEGHPKLNGKSVVIWNGIATPLQRETEAVRVRQELGIDKDRILVVMVGRLSSRKGQMMLVEAAQRLWNRNVKDVTFLIVGSPAPNQEHIWQELLDYIESTTLRANIVVWNFREDIDPIWEACDIAVVPSIEPESFGLVAIEAMAAKKPVVASNHGGVAEIVVHGHTGMLVTPRDTNALADAIESLVSDSQRRRRYGRNGYKRFQHLFTLTEYARGFNNLYCHLLNHTIPSK